MYMTRQQDPDSRTTIGQNPHAHLGDSPLTLLLTIRMYTKQTPLVTRAGEH